MWEDFQYDCMISKEALENFLKEGRIRPSPQFNSFMRVPENANYICESIYETLVDELSLGIVFSAHYEAKKGIEDMDEMEVHEQFEENKNTDIFGEPIMQKKTQKCVCPTCKHSLAASRFAPHLAKCLGLGRISSRIASRRIANNSKESGYGGMLSDDEDDADWTVGSDRRRRKRDRNGTRRLKTQKLSRNGDASTDGSGNVEVGVVPSATASSSSVSYDNMTVEEKRNLLLQICGVVSEHTRKLCTRSMRCPQHSDEQRRSVRAALLQDTVAVDMLQVDVDTYEEGDAHSMRESLGRSWEQEHSNTSSPADSASTSSSSSKKREKVPKVKSKNSSKNYKGSPNVLGSLPSLVD